MQCTSCRFENMPGVQICGRCGARLDLGTAAVDVHPPRASARAKRWRRWFPFQRFVYRLRDALATALPLFRPPAFDRPLPAVVVRMVVPGWPQMHSNQTVRGRIFLGLYLGLLLPGLLFAGTSFGSLLLGLAISVHVSSVMDVVFAGCNSWWDRAAFTTFFCLAIALAVYVPTVWLVTRVAVPQRIVLDAPPFQAGDVVLYNPSAYYWSEPETGDVVVYDIPTARINGTARYGAAVYDIRGLRLDRIVAGPQQKLDWNGKQLLVDGRPATHLPLNPERLPAKLKLSVPQGRYLILPSTDPVFPRDASSDAWAQVSTVPRESLLGKVYLRHQPLSRFWFVR